MSGDDDFQVTTGLEFVQPVEKLIPTADKTKRVEAKGVIQPGDLHIFLTEAILREVIDWSNTDHGHELGGVFVGDLYSYKGLPYLEIAGYIRARKYEHTVASFTFTHDTWSAISREKEQKYGDKLITGWHHTHPGYGIFLSGMDQFIHINFFNLPWMFAMVVDPKQETLGFFQMKKTKLEHIGFFFVR
jgi:proteasome lid subunit RPN8/RPN11